MVKETKNKKTERNSPGGRWGGREGFKTHHDAQYVRLRLHYETPNQYRHRREGSLIFVSHDQICLGISQLPRPSQGCKGTNTSTTIPSLHCCCCCFLDTKPRPPCVSPLPSRFISRQKLLFIHPLTLPPAKGFPQDQAATRRTFRMTKNRVCPPNDAHKYIRTYHLFLGSVEKNGKVLV